jgi:hypothetical protein
VQWHLLQNTFPRTGYNELTELIDVYLGEQVPGGFKPKRKGALQDARFMADAIYLLSMELLSTVYKMDPGLARQVHKMAGCLCCPSALTIDFLKFGLAPTAPANDLEFLYDMMELTVLSHWFNILFL